MTESDLSTLTAAQKRALLATKLRQGAGTAARRAPLSLAQQRLWFIDQMQPGQPVYTIAAALRLDGPLDAARLGRALDTVAARHDSLRTRFIEDGGTPMQVVDLPADVPLEHVKAADPDAVLRAFAARPFDLAKGPLLRAVLVRTTPDSHIFALAAHHIIADFRSLQVLISEVSTLYRAPETTLPPLPLQYADHALAQRGRLAELDGQLDYWRETLTGLPAFLPLVTDHPRPDRQDFNGARHRFELSTDLTRRIEALARDHGVTPFILCLAAFHILHARYSGTDDICIGTTVSNRDREVLQGLIGYFVNTLPLRCRVDPDDSLISLLARLRDTVLGAMRHQDVPFEQVVDTTVSARSLAHAPLFQSLFNLHQRQETPVDLPGLTVSPVALPGQSARFDLCLDLFHGDTMTGVLEYATALFTPATAAQMADAYVHILSKATAAPDAPLSAIDLRDDTAKAALEDLNATAAPVPSGGLAQLIHETATARGDAEALIAGTTTLSHAALEDAVARLAGYLAPRIAPGDRVAVALPRTADLVVTLLAVLRLGAAYVPLDPGHPAARNRMILEDAAPALLLTHGTTIPDAPCPVLDLAPLHDDVAAAAPLLPRPVSNDDIAYVIFTSGTTGRPKGVPIRQGSLVNLLASVARRPGMTDADRLIAVTTPAFDIAALELFLPLLTGGTLVLADAHDVIDGQALAARIAKTSATMMQATPATWRLLTEDGWHAPEGFQMLSGGEALDVALAARLLDGEGRLWNMYGPTETTIWSACAEITPADIDRGTIPIGQPVANTTLHVLDAALSPCLPDVPGELLIGGVGLSPGYLDRADLTAERFIACPNTEERLYRTGDLARMDRDGGIICLGRTDFQLKLRGFRIEPGEIEAALAEAPGVTQAVVTLHGSGEDAMLVAHLTGPEQSADLPAQMRAHLTGRVPGYMIPAHFVVVGRLPLNANGKVDRAQLRLPENALPAVATRPTETPPETGTEALLSRLWGGLLDHPAPGREADFFALGGHSLLAMRMVARLPLKGPRAEALRLLFEAPRLANYAAQLDRHTMLSETPPPPIPRLPEGTPRPLSHAQDRQWTLARLDPGHAAYHLPAALRLTGPVDADRLNRAFGLLCARHDLLRSAYPERAGRPDIITAQDVPSLSVEDVEDLPARLSAEVARPFDLSRPPLLRLSLFRTGETHVLLLVMHHIIADAETLELVLRELMATYAALGQDPNHQPAPLPVQYTDFAAWQRSQDTAAGLTYWAETLTGAPPLLELPTDFPRPSRQSFQGGAVDFDLSPETAARLRDAASRAGATPYMALLTLYAAFLGRYAEVPEVVIGTPVNQRLHPDLEGVAGMFANTLALRLPSSSTDSYTELLSACRDRTIAGFAHQDTPYEQVVERLAPERGWSHNPVFQAMFSWRVQSARPGPLSDGLSWQPEPVAAVTAKTDIALAVLDRQVGFALRLEYSRDLFLPDTARHMALSFETFVAAALSQPDTPITRLPLLHPEQKQQIAAWNDTGTVARTGPVTLHERFTARAAEMGDQPAIRHAAGTMSYAALQARSDRLAAHLQGLGVGPGDRVGIALHRRPDLITSLLAVLKTGAAYVPLDPAYPPERIAHIASDATLCLTLCDTALAGNALDVTTVLPPDWDDCTAPAPQPVAVGPDDTAYLIYTSGSTGLPKGVELTHGNADALIRWAETQFAPAELAGLLASTSVCFDLSVFEIFITLSLGGTLMLVDDVFDLPDAPFRDEVTLINTVPTPMAELLKLGPLPASVQTVCLAGEPLPPALAARIYGQRSVEKIWNLYGPSEDTTYSTAMILPRDGGFNIGAPIAGTHAHVLDDHLQPLPPGLPGELFLSGAGVGRGYWNQPEMTRDRFVPNPLDTDGTAPMMYRTGDRVRRRADGTLDYMGRGDRQVKIRGFRIEPGEVEAALTTLPGIRAAVVDGWQSGEAPLRLTAWVEGAMPEPEIVSRLLDRLPAHCVPSVYVITDALPRLPNGKLDRKALPAPAPGPTGDAPVEAPLPGVETQLAAIWARCLGRVDIGRHQGFFALGGDSILAIQVVAAAREEGLPLAPRDLFQYPTIARLADAIQGRDGLAAATGPVSGAQTLTPIQRWFLSRDLPNAHHWNQAMVLTPARPLDAGLLHRAMAELCTQHDALRARFVRNGDSWQQVYDAPGTTPRLIEATGDVTEAAARLQAGFDLARAPLWGAVLADTDQGQRLAVAAHHLIVDGVSWRILLADLQRIYEALETGAAVPPMRRGTSPGTWTDQLSRDPSVLDEIGYWSAALADPLPASPFAANDPDLTRTARQDSQISALRTEQLLDAVPAAFPVTAEEVLVSALWLALRDLTGVEELLLELESHGRADLGEDTDLSRTVGWLTALFPVRLYDTGRATPGEVMRNVKETLRAVPRDGIGYGVLHQLQDHLPALPPSGVRFNFHGRAGTLFDADSLFRPARESAGPTMAPGTPRDTALEVNAMVLDGQLRLGWSHCPDLISPADIKALADGFAAHLTTLIDHCLTGEDAGFSPADFPDMDFDQSELDDLLESL